MSWSTRNYLPGKPDCPQCQGIGYYRYNVPPGHPEFGRVHDCECRHTDPAAGGLARAWMNPDQVSEALRITADWWPEKPGRRRQQQTIDELLTNLCGGEATGGWVTLVGDKGTGKTSLLYYLAVGAIRAGLDVVYCDADRFKQATDINTRNDDGSLPGVNRLYNCQLALLDNLDWLRPTVSTGESYQAEMVRQVGNRRYEARHLRATVWAVNNEAWESQGGIILHSLFSRLSEGMIVKDRTENFRATLGREIEGDE